jgi:DNA repair protein RadD
MSFTPRYYQTNAVQAIFDYFAKGGKGNPVVVMPTGTGKSIVIGMFIQTVLAHYPSQRIILATHVKELIEQNANKVQEFWPAAPIGIYSAGLNQREFIQPIIYGGIQSMVKDTAQFGHRDLLLVDECHLISGKEDSNYSKFIAGLKAINPNLKIIGFTATDYRMGQGKLSDGPIFTDICYNIATLEAFNRLIDEGYMCTLIPKRTKTELNVEEVKIQAGEYNQKDLQEAVDKDRITTAAVKEIIEQGQDRRSWLVFATGVEHAKHIAECMKYYGIEAEAVHSKMSDDERDKIIRNFKNGNLRCVVNNNILTTGFDHPSMDLIAMLRPTASTSLWVQMLGRGTRPSPETGKENCLVLDFAGNTKRLGPINDPVLPRKKGTKEGTVPIRICDECGTYNHARAVKCICCGKEFPANSKITSKASSAELIKRTGAEEVPVLEKFAVSKAFYFRGVGTTSTKPFLKVNYACGVKMFTERVFLEADGGFLQRKANQWWFQRIATPRPKTVDEALQQISYLKVPRSITVWTNKRYPEVMSAEF